MKRYIKLFLAASLLLLTLNFSSEKAEAREAYEVLSHNVDMEVFEDGTIQVKETLSLHFTERRHGIIVSIPKVYNMTFDINGQTYYRKYNFPVTNIKVLSGHNYSVEDYTNGEEIQIGSSSYYADENEIYKWQYTIHTRDLKLDGLQMVFMNIIDDFAWGTDTLSCDFTIKMPKSFDSSKMYFATPDGMFSGTGKKGDFSVNVDGNTISGYYHGTIADSEGLTVQIILDDSYFKFANTNIPGIISAVIAVLAAVASSFVFLKYGKDDEIVRTVEFHAPEGVTSAEVGMIIDEEANVNDVVSLIIDWGRRGYLTIEETETSLLVTKVKEADGDFKGYERNLFNALFKKKDTVSIDSLRDSFYSKIDNCRNELNKYFDTKGRKLVTDDSVISQIFMTILAALPAVLATLICYKMYYFHIVESIFMAVTEFFLILFGTILLNYIVKKKYIMKLWLKILLILLTIIFYGAASLILLSVFDNCEVNNAYLLVVIAVEILIVIETGFMKKRTKYGNEMLGRILGFKEFIRVAEEDRLKALVEENPMYFYDVLPFAYALGLTNVWNDHFKNIEIGECGWYHSYYPYNDRYHMMHSFNSNMHSMQSAMTSRPAESSGGSSFSSSGGGGSSFSGGGGFGGSGGRSW